MCFQGLSSSHRMPSASLSLTQHRDAGMLKGKEKTTLFYLEEQLLIMSCKFFPNVMAIERKPS